MKNHLILNIIFFIFFAFTNLFAQSEIIQKREILSKKQKQLNDIEKTILQTSEEDNKAKENLIAIEERYKNNKLEYDNKKKDYQRASENIDLVSKEKLNELSEDYKRSDRELKEIEAVLKDAQQNQNITSKKLKQFINEKDQIEKDILDLKADIFDIELREPIWVLGEAVCNLAENETPDQCRDRAIKAATRDAMEKGGKMILESETIVKNYQLYLDEIRTHIKAQVIQQDNDPQYGVKREIMVDNIRYIAKLRLKVQSVSTYNPYRIVSSNRDIFNPTANIKDTNSTKYTNKDQEKIRIPNWLLNDKYLFNFYNECINIISTINADEQKYLSLQKWIINRIQEEKRLKDKIIKNRTDELSWQIAFAGGKKWEIIQELKSYTNR